MPQTFAVPRRIFLSSLSATTIAATLLPHTLLANIPADWTTPLPPFRIAGNLYYVGSGDLASYLLTTPAGLILINSNLATSPPQIRKSVEQLGFHWADVKILLISHAHYDHCAGSAQVQRETGAKYFVMDADIPVIQSGGTTDFRYAHDPDFHFPPTHVDRSLHDGEAVTLGGTTLTAHKTAGHTMGCTTWTLPLTENGKTYQAVIVGSPNVNPGFNLIDDPHYPHMAADFAQEFRTLKSLPCDIFLGAHGGYFDLNEKLARQKAGAANVFVDPAGYRAYIADRQQAFETELARQKTAKPSHKPA
jgi:metallo-beta-lactamase class B